MSTLKNSQTVWSIPEETLDSKYEKCRNITEEIYKRINITFQIKKLESAAHTDTSDSDQIDSNELSNETDLFACDKSDITSSTEPDKPAGSAQCDRYININNNEEMRLKKAAVTVYKRPRKRFRKRVKKRQSKAAGRSDSDGSSDEALPLSRMVELDTKCVIGDECAHSESPDNVMGVPKIVIVTKDLKPKIQSPDKKQTKEHNSIKTNGGYQLAQDKPTKTVKNAKNKDKTDSKPIDTQVTESHTAILVSSMEKVDEKSSSLDSKYCTMCSLTFRGERGLRRHMTMWHIVNPDDMKKSTELDQRDLEPA